MSCIFTPINELLSDVYLFPALQIALIAFVFFAMLMSLIGAIKAGKSGVTLSLTRGNESMGRFFGFYAAISGLLVAICLSSDHAKDYRVLWSVLDTVLVAYVCLFNIWFRNKLLGWVDHLTKIETR
jgi:hypothetical protein